MSTKLSSFIQKYIQSLHHDHSQRTARNYTIYLRRFANAVPDVSTEQLSPNHISQFTRTLQQTRTNRGQLMSAQTINYHLIAVRSLLTHARSQGTAVLDADQISLLPLGKRERADISLRDINALLEAPLHTAESDIIRQRDAALLTMLYSTGCKVSEIIQLKRSDVDRDQTVITIRGLRSAIRSLPISHQTRHRLRQYLQLRKDAASALFVRHDAAQKGTPGPLTPRSIQRMIQKYIRSAELPRDITPETLRQAYARTLAQRGEKTAAIQQRLGHADAATTRRYTKN